jgi:ketosteroid isomerase-like protein
MAPRELRMSRLLASCFAMVLLSVMVQSADDAKSTVTKLNEGWLAAHKAADFERLAARYTEDAVVMSPEGEPVQGREAIRNFFGKISSMFRNAQSH